MKKKKIKFPWYIFLKNTCKHIKVFREFPVATNNVFNFMHVFIILLFDLFMRPIGTPKSEDVKMKNSDFQQGLNVL